jgi:hypothetical protein
MAVVPNADPMTTIPYIIAIIYTVYILKVCYFNPCNREDKK